MAHHKKVIIYAILQVFLLGNYLNSDAQILDSENKLNIELSDGTDVTLYGAARPLSDEKSNEFYYLPTNYQLAVTPDNTPQFLFLKYTSEEAEDQGGISGAILHMLMEYGLDQDQEKELENILKSKFKGAVLKGVAHVEPDGNNSVRVISATMNDERARNLILSAKAPVLPGNKIALAADLDEKGAQLMAETFENTSSIADLSITFSYKYSVRFPAARGYIIEDWSKLDSLHLVDSAFYSHKKTEEKDWGEKTVNGLVGGLLGGPIGAAIGFFGSGNKEENHYSYDEVHNLYKFLEENEVIQMNFEENLEDERVDKIREAFFQHFLNRFTEKDGAARPSAPGEREIKDIPDIKTGDSYQFRREFVETILQKSKRVFNLNYRMAVNRSFQVTENLGTWYDNVRDNPKCVGLVNLNDPFFQHRKINIIMDLDAEDMIGSEMNFVTVSLRKQRQMEDTHDFSHQITFDKKFFEENGNRATVTYSKAQSEEPDLYEYKVQWSLRGGHIFPSNDTTWTKGNWQGITLYPPVKPVPLRFEAELDELKKLDIRNVTLQVRYMKFGKETEANLNISLYSEVPYAEKTIYMDKDTQGYAYRLVFTHKIKGVMAMPWESKINTNYIFAVVPEELRAGDQNFIEEAIEAGKVILTGSDSKEVSDSLKVLDKFRDVVMQ